MPNMQHRIVLNGAVPRTRQGRTLRQFRLVQHAVRVRVASRPPPAARLPTSNFGVSTGDPEQPANPRPGRGHATCLRLIMNADLPPCSLCYRETALIFGRENLPVQD